MEKKVYVSSNKYTKEILRRYQQKHGDIKKEVIPLKLKERTELERIPFPYEKGYKQFQHTIRVRKWLIVAGIFNITYDVTSISIFSASNSEGHL